MQEATNPKAFRDLNKHLCVVDEDRLCRGSLCKIQSQLKIGYIWLSDADKAG
jgi:DNA primase large subunit